MKTRRVFLDNAATTPIDPSIVDMMTNMMKINYGNPSSIHSFGRESKTLVEKSRKTIANLLNTSPSNIFFTSGGTEADNMAIKCSINDYDIKHAITSKISHHAVLYPLQDLEEEKKIELSYVDIDKYGIVSLDHLEDLLKSRPRTFVSIMHANNEIGTIQPLKEIGDICKKYDAIFHSDTVQTMAHFPFDIKELDVHFMAASAHKFHGPKGVGFIYISEDINISPMIRGGEQERKMRAGTENVLGIAALATAMEISYKNLDEDIKYIKDIKLYMIEQLKIQLPNVGFYAKCTDIDNSLYTVLSIYFPKEEDHEMLFFNLDIMGIACSGGSACASGGTKGSHVFSNIMPDKDVTGIRFSFSKYTTRDDIDYTINALKTLI